MGSLMPGQDSDYKAHTSFFQYTEESTQPYIIIKILPKHMCFSKMFMLQLE